MRAFLLVLLPLASQAPPPQPWACDRSTLMDLRDDRICTFEGKTAAQPPSKEQAKETKRDARALLLDACAEVAQGALTEPSAAIVAWCTARADSTVRVCGGDGARRLRDDDGRFNPGHARCYAALRSLLIEAALLFDERESCCGCAHDQCGADEEQCTAKLLKGALPTGTCASTCAAACAASTQRLAPRRTP
jgi:hypothetical protein